MRLPQGTVTVVSYDTMARLYRGGWWLDPEGESYQDKAGRERTRKAWVRRGGSRFLETKWDFVVFDESHEVRNGDRLVSKWRACSVATRSSDRVWLLSGTPIQNGPADISGQLLAASSGCALTDPQRFGAYGCVDAGACRLLRPLLITVTLEDAAVNLPEKKVFTDTIHHELEGEDLDQYNETLHRANNLLLMRNNGRPTKEALNELRTLVQTLRSLALDPAVKHYHGGRKANGEPGLARETFEGAAATPGAKLKRCVELARELLGRHEKIVIVCDSVVMLELVCERMHLKMGIIPPIYSGSLTPDQKDRVVQSFTTDPKERVLLLSLAAGGVGLNLQVATAMINLSYWYNPARHEQAEARIHRRGQTKPVEIHRIVARETIDQALLYLHEDKSLCSKLVLSAGGGSSEREKEGTSQVWKRFGRIVGLCRSLRVESSADLEDPKVTAARQRAEAERHRQQEQARAEAERRRLLERARAELEKRRQQEQTRVEAERRRQQERARTEMERRRQQERRAATILGKRPREPEKAEHLARPPPSYILALVKKTEEKREASQKIETGRV